MYFNFEEVNILLTISIQNRNPSSMNHHLAISHPAKKLFGIIILNFIFSLCINAQSYSLFNADTEIPNIINNQDGQPITVGIKFKTTQNGVINGIRYYQGNTNVDNAAHTGLLYNFSGGTPLASATFATVTSFQGWRQVLFATPVSVTAGSVYVAAVFSAGGYYQAISPTAALRLNAPIIRTPLVAIADNDAQGPNAVYNYSPGGTPVFPTQSFQANNYFVDVIFTPLIILPTTPIQGLLLLGRCPIPFQQMLDLSLR
jgi:Domain of unknown function (DUF4082)